MIYPWQQATWLKLIQNWQKEANAWLFFGRKHIGKFDFVTYYAKALLCENTLPSTNYPCEKCQSCHLFNQNSHPDLYLLRPENASSETSKSLGQIKIDAIRRLTEKLQLSSYLGGCKVVIIETAEAMTIQAANALLKILEEPPEKTIFLLISNQKDRLLATIRSRCKQVALPLPTLEQTVNYLNPTGDATLTMQQVVFHGGVPFYNADFPESLYNEFLTFMCSPRILMCLDFSKRYEQEIKSLDLFFDWLYKWIVDLTLINNNMNIKFNLNITEQLEKIKNNYPLPKLFKLLDSVNEQAKYKNHPLNTRLQIESLLMEYLMISMGQN